jgi:hypothetical protein
MPRAGVTGALERVFILWVLSGAVGQRISCQDCFYADTDSEFDSELTANFSVTCKTPKRHKTPLRTPTLSISAFLG